MDLILHKTLTKLYKYPFKKKANKKRMRIKKTRKIFIRNLSVKV